MKYFFHVLFLFLTINGWSQDLNYKFNGRITNQDNGSNEGGVTIKVLRDGAVVATTQTSSNGKYSLEAMGPKTGKYEIVYSKPGMVTKKISFDGSKLVEEDLPAGNTVPFPALDLDLFAERENVDFSFLNTEYVASFFWNDRKFALDFDRVASEKVKKKIEDLLLKAEKDKAEAEMKYLQAIQKADEFYAQEKYEEALGKYEEALTYKPKEPYPTQKIIELDALIKAKKEQDLADAQKNAEYNNLIKAADNLRDQGKLEDAVSKYTEALTKKQEQYPKDQISALNAQIEQKKKEAENQAKYDEAVSKGDMFLKQNSLQAARDKYTEATKLKPSENYPKQKLKEIEDKLKAKEELDAKKKKYEEAVAAADQLFTAEDYKGAKSKYEEALTFEASSTYVKERVKICDQKIAEIESANQLATKITELMKAGNASMTSKDYASAKAKFEEVLGLDAAHAEAKTQLNLVNQKLAELAANEAKQKEFNDLVAAGDQAVKSLKWEDAIASYEAAIAIQVNPEVNQKLKDAKTALAKAQETAAKKEQYENAIKEANNLMASGDLTGAKSKYKEAQTIDSAQKLPGEKIIEIDKLLADKDAEAQKQAKLEQALKDGDHNFNNANWTEADKRYREALTFDPSNTHAKNRISEIAVKVAEEKKAADTKAKFDQAIKAANDHYTKAQWVEAKKKYEEALTIVPDDTFAKDRLNDVSAKIEADAKAKELENKVKTLLTEGKALKDQKKLDAAKTKYEEVLGFDAGNAEALKALEEINNALSAMKSEAEKEEAFKKLKEEGFNLASSEKYTEAKNKLNEALSLKDDSEVKAKIKEIDTKIAAAQNAQELEEKYNAAMTAAQNLESQNNLSGAIAKYKEALLIKPAETLPKTKIAELENKLRENSDQAKLDADYKAAMSQGDQLKTQKDYLAAKAAYSKAASLKPSETLPAERIREIDEILKSTEDQARIDKEYRDWMKKGDELMTAENYLGAIDAYNNALSVKPTEKEPVTKADEARRLEEAKGDADKEYEKILSVAEAKMNEGDYARATELAERAMGLKPTDPRPQTLLNKINQLRQIDAEYNELMKKGNELALSKNYKDAKIAFEGASKKKPSEQLPKDKIAEMDKLLDSQSSSAQKEALYKEYMAKGNEHQINSSFEQALSSFQDALAVKPGDITAENKIKEIQQILDDIANKQAMEVGKKNAFDKLIKEADVVFGNEKYLDAKAIYERALSIDPSSSYAQTQINECVRLEKLITDSQLEAEYRKIIAAADKNFDKKSYDKAKEYYNRALSFKSNDPYPKKKLAEIEAILNPVTLSSADLEDLGDPVDNTIMDGGYILQQADKERELAKGLKVTSTYSNIKDAESEMTREKTQGQYDRSNDIYKVQMLIATEDGVRDLNQQAMADALRKAQVELENADRVNSNYEHNANVLDQNTLYDINNEVALEYGEDIAVYAENADIMKAYNTAQAEKVSEQMKMDRDANLNTDSELTSVKNEIDSGVLEDIAKREAVTQTLITVERAANEANLVRSEDKYVDQLGNKEELRKIEIGVEDKFSESSKMAMESNEELIKLRGDVVREEHTRTNQNELHLRETNEGVNEVKRYIEGDSKDRDGNRLNSVEVLKEEGKELADAEYRAYNTAVEKNTGNKELIEEKVRQNGEIIEHEKEAHALKVEYMDQVEDKISINYTETQKSDEEERLAAKKSVEDVYTGVQTTAQEEVEKTKGNAATINETTKTIDKSNSNKSIGQQEKHYEAANQIGDVDNSLQKQKVLANELGSEYPEGVSQENFERKDKNGLVNTFITRRIVVIEGHADVYVRTQTSTSITYTKNGKPIVEHVWNSETQGPHLERHY